MIKAWPALLISTIVFSQTVDVFVPPSIDLRIDKPDLKGPVRKVILSEQYFENDDLKSSTFEALKRDETGFLFGKKEVLSEFEISERIYIRYNERKQRTLFEEYDDDGELDDKMTYTYNANGQLIEIRDFDEDGELQKTISYEYNERGDLVSETFRDEDGDMRDKNVLVYTKDGYPKLYLDYDSDNELERRTLYLNYDAHGNWTRKITQSMDEDGYTRMLRREIEY